jgi:hypothetical protein
MAKRKEDPEFDPPDERPWDEEKWEAFMRESDLRSARYGEILETVMDDPDRDRIIAKEMGWDWLSEALDEREAAGADKGAAQDAEVEGTAADAAQDDENEEDDGDDIEHDVDLDDFDLDEADIDVGEPAEGDAAARRRGRHSIPAYRLAFKVGMKVHEALRPYSSKAVDDHDDEVGERLGKAAIGCHIAAAKISGGHAMGYEDDVLCGNIVNCKRGLAGVKEAEEALLELKKEGVLPAELVDGLLPDVRSVIDAVQARIEELRARVWW